MKQESAFAIGVITTPRGHLNETRVISELREGGFDETVHVFCEPGAAGFDDTASVETHVNVERLGALGNWAHCLRWLYDNVESDYLLISEDDVEYCRGAKTALLSGLRVFRNFGFLSLYTPKRDALHAGQCEGWFQANHGRKACGTQSMCFSRDSAEILLGFPRLHMDNQISGPTDSIVSECFLLRNIACFYHRPSLTEHLGRISTIGHKWQECHTGLDYDRNYFPSHNAPVQS
jgi:hypothetical protein